MWVAEWSWIIPKGPLMHNLNSYSVHDMPCHARWGGNMLWELIFPIGIPNVQSHSLYWLNIREAQLQHKMLSHLRSSRIPENNSVLMCRTLNTHGRLFYEGQEMKDNEVWMCDRKAGQWFPFRFVSGHLLGPPNKAPHGRSKHVTIALFCWSFTQLAVYLWARNPCGNISS